MVNMNKFSKILLLSFFITLISACKQNVSTSKSREIEEAGVYSFLLNQDPKGYIGDSSVIIVLDETYYDSFNDDKNILGHLRTLDKSTLADYRVINQKSQKIQYALSLNKPYEIISMDEMNLRDKENQDWFNTHTFTVFSRVGFNESFEQALVYVEHNCGGECATGDLYFLKLDKGVWKIKSILEGWVS
jgi:hypothetical protein